MRREGQCLSWLYLSDYSLVLTLMNYYRYLLKYCLIIIFLFRKIVI